MTARPLDRLGVGLMLLICISLGVNQIAAKIALGDVPPLIQAGIRSVLATLILGAIATVTEPRLYARDKTLWAGLILGVFFSGEFATLFLGLKLTTASHSVLFLYTAPFFVAFGLWLFVPAEKLRPLQWAGMILSFLGVIVALRTSSALSPAMLAGDLLCLAGGACWGVTTVLVKATALRAAPPIKVLLYQLAVSAVLIPALAVAFGETWPTHISYPALASMAYQLLWVICAMFSAWFWLLKHYRAGELSAFTFVTPVIGVFAGWLLLGDRLDAGFILAIALVAAGLVLVTWPPRALRTNPLPEGEGGRGAAG